MTSRRRSRAVISLGVQRFDGIEVRRLTYAIEAKADSNCRGEHQRQRDRWDRDGKWEAALVCGYHGYCHATKNADSPANVVLIHPHDAVV